MKITSEASAISGGLKELGGYAAAFGEARKIGNLKDLAKQIGPFLGESPLYCLLKDPLP